VKSTTHRYVQRVGTIGGKPATATFSPDGQYRYHLARQLGETPHGHVTFIMCNPSDADHERDDATVRRCRGFATRLGAAGFEVVNAFALVAHQPKRLLEADDPVGPVNDIHIAASCLPRANRTVIAAWGAMPMNYPLLRWRISAVLTQLDMLGTELHALGDLTAAGQPRHPLYLKADAPLRPVHLALGQVTQ
jgi:hypothetical protein